MNDNKVKVFGYKRVSTEEQVEGMSLQNQQLTIEAYARLHNFEIVDIFSDEGYSAKTAKRPKLQEMLTRLNQKNNDVKGVIVYNLSRISRDMESYFRDIGYHLSARGVSLYSTLENIDDTAQGRLMRNISLSMHQYDNDVKSQTTKDNMHLVALEGWWQGKVPYGYKAIKEPVGIKAKDGRQKERLTLKPDVDNDLSEKIRMFLERFSKGDITQAELAGYAESIGLKSATGGSFAPQSVKNLLTKMVYAGFICSKLTEWEPIMGRHPGIISLETFNRNQALISGRKPASFTPRFTMEYPLKYSLLCVSCRQSLTGSAPTTGSGKRSPRYHCTRCKGMGSISSDKMDRIFNDFLRQVTPLDSTIRLYKLIVRRTASTKLSTVNTQLSTLRDQLSKIDDDMQKALQKFLDDDISKSEKEEYQNSLRFKRIGIEGQIDKLEDMQRLNEATIEYVCNFIDAPSKMWQDADPLTKVEFQKMVIPEGIEFDIKAQKFGTNGISPLYRLRDTKKEPSASDDSLMVISRRIELRLPG
jgi:site-specific DNA recombinase